MFWKMVMVLGVAMCCSAGTVPLKDLPPEEQKLAGSADPWGLSFGDQVVWYQARFAAAPKAAFAVGVTHNLVKLRPNKYWYRGESVVPGEVKELKPVSGWRGATVSFQVVVLPRLGAAPDHYTLKVTAPVPVTVWREEFVQTAPAEYPRFTGNEWPDPLLPENACDLSGIKPGIFLVELAIPETFNEKTFPCAVTVTVTDGAAVALNVPVHVFKLTLPPVKWPLTAWFWQRDMSEVQFKEMCRLALAHGVQPLIADYLKKQWQAQDPAPFDAAVTELAGLGQTVFEIKVPDIALYEHLKQKGWLDRFMIYSNADEPFLETFRTKNIPYAAEMREKFPGLTVFLASEYHPQMADGCDRWLTDLSSLQYDPRTFKVPAKPELWHYYCHMPINFQMRAPLSQAPNMLLDNAALEHRLALWMSWYYGARGVFIFAGNCALPKDFWTNLTLDPKPYPYPSGGVHNGNGFLVYPPKEKDGPVLPSLRLKILRDAMQDIALLEHLKAKLGRKWERRMGLNPDVFRHPHYYDQLPETLLEKREALLRLATE